MSMYKLDSTAYATTEALNTLIDRYVIAHKKYPTALILTLDQYHSMKLARTEPGRTDLLEGPLAVDPANPALTEMTFRNIPVYIEEFLE